MANVSVPTDVSQFMRPKIEWVEIREPKTRMPMFVHLETGDCVDSVPDLSTVKRLDKNQWWEFFDQNTSRFYYYNYYSEKTEWQKPNMADIIPLAKLQNLKQHTKVNYFKRSSCSAGTQTIVGTATPDTSANSTPNCRRNASMSARRGTDICKTPTQSRRRDRSATMRELGQNFADVPEMVQEPHYYSPASSVQRYPSHHSVQSSWSSGHGTLQRPGVSSCSPLPGRQAPSEVSLDSGCGLLHCDAAAPGASWDSGSDQGYASVPRPAQGTPQSGGTRPRQFPRTNPALVRPSPVLTRSPGSPVAAANSSRSQSTVSVSSGSTTIETPQTPVQRQVSEPLHHSPTTSPSLTVVQNPLARPQSMMVTETSYLHQPTRSASGQFESHVTPPGWAPFLFRTKERNPQKLLCFSKDTISKPLLAHTDKSLKKESCEVFKNIQCFMGDRKSKQTQMQLAQLVVNKGWLTAGLRDEILMQLCKQNTKNDNPESLLRGWELLTTCLAFFPPSPLFATYVEGYLLKHQDPSEPCLFPRQFEYACVAYRRLKRVLNTGARKGNVHPSQDEVLQARNSILVPGVFGSTVDELMTQQRVRGNLSDLPWVHSLLCEEVVRLGGLQTEGIFRVPGDVDLVNAARVRLEQWDIGACRGLDEPFTAASLLKLWYREMTEPLVPLSLYASVLEAHENPGLACHLVTLMPIFHKGLLCSLVRFLRRFCSPTSLPLTKMPVESLALVMAPNLFRHCGTDATTVFNNSRRETAFLKNLLLHLPLDAPESPPSEDVYLDEVCAEESSSSSSEPKLKESVLLIKDDLPGIDEEVDDDVTDGASGIYENSSPPPAKSAILRRSDPSGSLLNVPRPAVTTSL